MASPTSPHRLTRFSCVRVGSTRILAVLLPLWISTRQQVVIDPVLSPDLKQVFFMGDGLTSGSAVQEIVAPVGATRLYLGTMDGFEWSNNTGAFEVTIAAWEFLTLVQPPFC